MTHAGRCSLCFTRQGKHPLGLPAMTVKTVSIVTLKINEICGIFKGGPEFVVLADGESLAVLL